MVVENIMRHRSMGKLPAGLSGFGGHDYDAGGIHSGPFLGGMIKFLFVPLALAATMTIAASYFVAMKVAPSFCAKFLGKGDVQAVHRMTMCRRRVLQQAAEWADVLADRVGHCRRRSCDSSCIPLLGRNSFRMWMRAHLKF